MRQTINEALALIFRGIAQLHRAFPRRAFTIDGRLVGDIGEVIAELEYDVKLDEVSSPGHDARMPDGRRVQVKATFKDSLTFKTCPDYYGEHPISKGQMSPKRSMPVPKTPCSSPQASFIIGPR